MNTTHEYPHDMNFNTPRPRRFRKNAIPGFFEKKDMSAAHNPESFIFKARQRKGHERALTCRFRSTTGGHVPSICGHNA